MNRSLSVADAKARFSEFLDRVENGQTVVITRRGKAVARLIREGRKPTVEIDLERLRTFRESLPTSEVGTSESIRRMRDEDRL